MRQHDAQGPDDVRGAGQQHLALHQCLAHQPEFEMLEIAQSAMDELGRRRGGPTGEVVHFGKEDRIAAAGSIARDAASVDAAADDENVVDLVAAHVKPLQLPPVARFER